MADVNFSRERFDVLQEMKANHFWYAGRRLMLLNMLNSLRLEKGALAVDIGCGPGLLLSEWLAYADKVVGFDQYDEGATARAGISRMIGEVSKLPFEDNSVDLSLLLDVLEHVPEDSTLSEVTRVLKPGGVLLISVPAFQWLWSYRDEDAGHLRRYTKTQLRDAVQRSGLTVGRTRYYQFFLFPLVALTRKLGKRSPDMRNAEDFPARPINAIFRMINKAEAWMDGLGVAFPIGSSIILVARKP